MSSKSQPALIGFVTCADLSRFFPSAEDPLLTHDDLVAAEALRRRGLRVEPVVWGAPPVELARRGFALLVVRSPWDYMDSASKREGFFAWVDAVEAAGLALSNPAALLRWNLDKHYLRQLADEGVAVVPSRFVDRGEPAALAAIAAELDSEALVVKPCVSAGARDTFLLRGSEIADFDFSANGALRRGRDFIVQPFLEQVTSAGEWSLVFIEGRPVHAVLKRPPAGGWLVQDELGGSVSSGEPPEPVAQLAAHAASRVAPAFARAGGALDPTPGWAPLYARVDVIEAGEGEPLVGELELVEPELFFLERRLARPPRPAPRVIDAFCDAVIRRLG